MYKIVCLILILICTIPTSLHAMEALDQEPLLEDSAQSGVPDAVSVQVDPPSPHQNAEQKEGSQCANGCSYFIAVTVPTAGCGLAAYLFYYFHQQLNQ
jgi:hypothetical protein